MLTKINITEAQNILKTKMSSFKTRIDIYDSALGFMIKNKIHNIVLITRFMIIIKIFSFSPNDVPGMIWAFVFSFGLIYLDVVIIALMVKKDRSEMSRPVLEAYFDYLLGSYNGKKVFVSDRKDVYVKIIKEGNEFLESVFSTTKK